MFRGDPTTALFRTVETPTGAAIRDRSLLEDDLRHAISRHELTLVYQPQVRLDDEEPVGFEGLLRWRHPERGDVLPAVFIPIAEENGLIGQIGEWVLRTACLEAVGWSRPLSIAVNVSTVQLHDPNFAGLVHEILFQTGLSPKRLEFEITETAMIRDVIRTLHTLRRIKALGVRIAMDDFGTGYSSLANLRNFPFDRIKIDASFIESVNCDEQAATIVRSVLALGRGLGLSVLAEGVETADQMEFLSREFCSEAQGYFLGRPEKIDTFRQLTHGLGWPEAIEDRHLRDVMLLPPKIGVVPPRAATLSPDAAREEPVWSVPAFEAGEVL